MNIFPLRGMFSPFEERRGSGSDSRTRARSRRTTSRRCTATWAGGRRRRRQWRSWRRRMRARGVRCVCVTASMFVRRGTCVKPSRCGRGWAGVSTRRRGQRVLSAAGCAGARLHGINGLRSRRTGGPRVCVCTDTHALAGAGAGGSGAEAGAGATTRARRGAGAGAAATARAGASDRLRAA